ncbi:MAG: ferritin-like domain-containing protein [Thermoanaerobaculia bacterium]
MIYERYFRRAERVRWQIDDFDFGAVDAERAAARPDLLATLREAALIESYAPMFALRGLRSWWNSIEESAIASIQFYEEYKHYFALKLYLERAGIEIPEREILSVRTEEATAPYRDKVRQLANYMVSEHFTAYFYQRLLEQADEPVLRRLLECLIADERRHCSVYFDLLAQRIVNDRSEIDSVLEEVVEFRHQASEVVGENVPVAMRNDFEAVVHLWNRVERLTGVDVRTLRRQALPSA